jgi:hypothetical protein
MDDQPQSQNSERKLEIDYEVIKPYLEKLDDLLKRTALEIENYGRMKGLNHLSVAANVNDLKGSGTVEGDAYLGSDDKELPIVNCYLRKDPLKNTIRCYNKQTSRSFEIPNSSYLQDIEESVRGLLSTIYWRIHKDYEKELLEKGVPLNVIRDDEPIKLSKLYAYINNINSGQESNDNPKIRTYVSQDGKWLITYDRKGSEIHLFFKYCDFKA